MSLIGRLLAKSSRRLVAARSYSDTPKRESPLRAMLEDAATYEDARAQHEWATHPYPRLPKRDSDAADEAASAVDARETTIVLFPGQGTQYAGMGRRLLDYPNVKEIYECASEVAKVDLTKIETPEDVDKYAQISIVAASLAAVEKLRDERPSVLPACVGTAGFSLGEITALIFAGAIELEQGFQLVNIRSLAMEAAAREHPGAMTTVTYQPGARLHELFDAAKEHCLRLQRPVPEPVCCVASYLYAQCVVVSGSLEAIDYVERKGAEYGVRRTKRLHVAGAFHTEHMRGAVEPFRRALEGCTIVDPKVPVYSSVNKNVYRSAKYIMKILPQQIVLPVKWEQAMHFMYARDRRTFFPKTFECGPGATLRTILRKVNAPAWDSSFTIMA